MMIDKHMTVKEALWILGYRDIEDFDSFMRKRFQKPVLMSDTEGWSNRELNEHIELLEEKIAGVQEWAYLMGLMYEDCAYLSHEAFEKDAKAALAELVERVGKWVPPEMRSVA